MDWFVFILYNYRFYFIMYSFKGEGEKGYLLRYNASVLGYLLF